MGPGSFYWRVVVLAGKQNFDGFAKNVSDHNGTGYVIVQNL